MNLRRIKGWLHRGKKEGIFDCPRCHGRGCRACWNQGIVIARVEGVKERNE